MQLVWILAALCTRVCLSLYVAKGSPCSTKCNSTGGTYWPDLVCSDDDFSTTPKGQTLQSCLECTVGSLYINSSYTDGNSDQFWALFHLKYVQEYCLIDKTTPHIAAVNACTSACSPLSNVLDTLWINKSPFIAQYNYCTSDSSAYASNAEGCSTCLQAQKGSVIIGNFVDTMLNACKTKPLASNGQLIVPERDLFDTAVIRLSSSISTATTTSKSRSASKSSTSTATASSSSTSGVQPTNTVESAPSHALSTGAAAGIGAAAAILGLGAIVAIALLFRRRRRRDRVQESQPLAMELNQPNSKHGYNVTEKPADSQIYEAPSGPQSQLIELPGSGPWTNTKY